MIMGMVGRRVLTGTPGFGGAARPKSTLKVDIYILFVKEVLSQFIY